MPPEPTPVPGPAPTPAPPPSPAPTPRPAATDGDSRRAEARRFIAAKGGAERAVRFLMRDLGVVQKELDAAKRRPAAPEGAVVLTGDDVKLWADYQALGKPADLTARLGKADEDAGYRAKHEATQRIAAIAEAAGLKPKMLARIARDLPAGARLEAREVEVDEDGEKVKRQVAHVVTGTGDAAKAEALDVYGAREIDDWADFLPALRGDADAAEQDAGGAADRSPHARPTTGGSQGTGNGGAYPEQRSGSSAPAKESRKVVDDYRARVRTSPAKWAAAKA